MKTLKQKNNFLKIAVGIIFVVTVGFAIYQSQWLQDRKQNIIGTWVIDNEPGNKWIFTSNQCKWELDGITLNTFTYTVNSEITQSGLEITFVKLVNINNPDDIIEYDINSLGIDKMTLTTLKPKIDYTHFTKQ